MNTFSTGAALRFGWETFKKRSWFLVGATLLALVLMWVTGAVQDGHKGYDALGLLAFLASLGLSTLVDMGLTSFTLRAHDDITKVSLHDLWHPRSFWSFLAAAILVGLAVVFGLILFIIPGVILMLMFAFVKFLVIDRDLGPIEAMKESAHITHGHRFELLLLFLAIIGLNVFGAILLIVGLLVTIPVSMLSLAYTYRTLARQTSDAHANTSPISS